MSKSLRSLLCEVVTATSMAELLAARGRLHPAADMVELRLDGIRDLDVPAAVRGWGRPIIVTVRASWEGGHFDGAEEERHRFLSQAVDSPAEYIDIEWRAGFADLIARDPKRIVLSSHDFTGVPTDVCDRARAMHGTGAGLIKVAVAGTRLSDSLVLREIASGGNAVVIAMGDGGLPTRLLAAQFGSQWTYAGSNAPGQVTPTRMVEEFDFRRVTASTRVFGVVSTNALHSLSPLMHNAAFRATGLDAVYIPLRATDFGDFVEFAAAVGIEGASITIPFKGDALRAATTVDDAAQAVGAVNTLRRRGDGWDATNTDVAGFLAPLDTAFRRDLRGARASVLGAGGSARAVIAALRERGAAVTVHARRPEQAAEVIRQLGASEGSWPPAAGQWDLLVNCTPLGGASLRDESPLPGGPFDGQLVYDLTYGPGRSRLLAEASAAGCAVLDGLPMLIAQAERQFEWWTGQRPPVGVMEAAVRKRTCN
jgi:3-dehydroquinate dehydratase / shikimate dehydrogenase